MSQKNNISPPSWPLRFLRWFCDPDLLEDIEGDLTELFYTRSEESLTVAKNQFAKDVLFLFRPGIIKNFSPTFNTVHMLRNYMLVALRGAQKYKGHTALNLLSLIIGVSSCILIMLWIQDERNIDKFHEKDDRLYQVWRNMYQSNGQIITAQSVPQPFIESLRTKYPEVDEATLLSWDFESLLRHNELSFYEIGKYVSPEFFSIFSFPFTAGDPISALSDVSSIVISESLALKYFGRNWKEDGIIGQTINLDGRKNFEVTGVFEDLGPKSSIQFDWAINAEEYIQRNDWVPSWYNGGFRMYFTLQPGAELASLQEKALQEINENTNYDADERIYLNKFSDNYLYSNFENGRPSGGRIQYIRLLFIIAMFVLVIACINFMNLATAQSSRRFKEIGVRKVLGAQKGSLRYQFFIESMLLSFVAVLIALLVVLVVLPKFNIIADKTLVLDLTDSNLWIGIMVVTVVTGLLSGSYPAMLLASFKVISSLKGEFKQSFRGIRFREGLVVFQFTLSMILIIGTLVVSRQMDYILNKNLGLDKENLVFINMSDQLTDKMETYKTELLALPGVSQVTMTSGNPISYGRSSGSAQWAGKDPDEEVEINVLSADEDFIETMKMDIINGRNFSSQFGRDTSNYIINEVTAGIMGFDDPVNQELSIWGQKGTVIGVVKDFHMSSMYEPIAPLIIRNDPNNTFVAFIRTQGNVQDALTEIESVTKELNPGYPFAYDFLDQSFREAYTGEMTLGTITKIFAFISILISCLGLFGLSSYTAEQRSKEIGIRKVYGASVVRIVSMLSWGYAKLILIAFILAAPVAWYFMAQWLKNFEFRTDLTFFVLLSAGVITFAIGAFTVGLKSWQAALASPIHTLKEE